MSKTVKSFTTGIARSRVSLLGAMIVTITTPFLFGAMIYDALFHIGNTYYAAAVYMLLGPAFLGGLVMIFVGLLFFKGKEEVKLFTMAYLQDYFTDAKKFRRMRKILFFTVFLTCVNVFIFSLLGYRSYHYMESVSFCGEFCHTVMNPERTAYLNSPHSRVACVECHIGSGAGWFVKSKISGARQLFAVALNTYPRPIGTPVHGLRPARDTCEECHRPEMFHGEKLVIKDKFREDENNTHLKTVLLMKIGSAGDRAKSSHGIHWHVAPENKITYKASDHSRLTLPEVTLTKADGSTVVYRSSDADELLQDAGHEAGHEVESREMDCIDCHNRPTHIYLPADVAIDDKLLNGEIPVALPFVKKMAMAIVTRDFASQDEAKATIEAELTAFYKENYGELLVTQPEILPRAIAGIQKAYCDNVFPDMNIVWGTYSNHLGHVQDSGCFRCHDEEHESEDGEVISMDCDTCHVILAEEEEDPEILQTLSGE